MSDRNCCGDAHLELEATLRMIGQLGFEQETIKHASHTEIVWHNRRWEQAEAKLTKLSIAAAQLIGAAHSTTTCIRGKYPECADHLMQKALALHELIEGR